MLHPVLSLVSGMAAPPIIVSCRLKVGVRLGYWGSDPLPSEFCSLNLPKGFRNWTFSLTVRTFLFQVFDLAKRPLLGMIVHFSDSGNTEDGRSSG